MRPARRLLLLLLAVLLCGLLAALATLLDWPQLAGIQLLFWVALGAVALLALLDAGTQRRPAFEVSRSSSHTWRWV